MVKLAAADRAARHGSGIPSLPLPWAIIPQRRANPRLQDRHNVPFEPWISLHPKTATPGWMGQGKEFRPIDAEVTDDVRQGLTPGLAEIVLLGVAADQQGQSIGREPGQNAFMPKGRAFRAWGQVAA